MDYTLSNVHIKINNLTDKMGSDYFPLPLILEFFETSAFNFIGEKLKIIEKTQEITDEIRDLIVPGSLLVIPNPSNSLTYIASLPANYHRLISYDVFYTDGTRCRRADLLRQAEYKSALINPNKKPTKFYPIILQENGLFEIDAGSSVPERLKIKYCKNPTIATTGQPTLRIINLPNESIEKILLMTSTALFNKTGDKRTQSNYQLQETFKKVFK